MCRALWAFTLLCALSTNVTAEGEIVTFHASATANSFLTTSALSSALQQFLVVAPCPMRSFDSYTVAAISYFDFQFTAAANPQCTLVLRAALDLDPTAAALMNAVQRSSNVQLRKLTYTVASDASGSSSDAGALVRSPMLWACVAGGAVLLVVAVGCVVVHRRAAQFDRLQGTMHAMLDETDLVERQAPSSTTRYPVPATPTDDDRAT